MALTKNKSRLNLNIDSDLKENVGKILSEMGLDYTTAINIYFRKILTEQKIPFEISVRKNLTVDEIFGKNWRDGLDEIEDDWELPTKLN